MKVKRHHKDATKNFDYITIADRLKSISRRVVALKNQQKITYAMEFSIVNSGAKKYKNFEKRIKLDLSLFVGKTKLVKDKKYLQQTFSRKVLVHVRKSTMYNRVYVEG